MKVQEKTIKELEEDLKRKEILEDKISTVISNLYKERFTELEREKKVFLDRFLISTEGKDIILENKL